MAYVYRHIRPDTDEVFYIGVGSDGSSRYGHKVNRNRFWRNIVAKNNGVFRVDILFKNLSQEEAGKKEKEFIALYGRSILNEGTLCNLQEGGNFHGGYQMSEDTRKKMAVAHKGNTATKGYIRITDGFVSTLIPSNKPLPEGWFRGEPKRKRFSEESRLKMSLSKKGQDMGFTKEQRQVWSKGNAGSAGHYWVNNGIISKYQKAGEPVPDGWTKGRIRTWVNQFEK